MRKYRLIKETNTRTLSVQYILQERFFILFWKDINWSSDLEKMHDRILELRHQNEGKLKREEVAIDNIYI